MAFGSGFTTGQRQYGQTQPTNNPFGNAGMGIGQAFGQQQPSPFGSPRGPQPLPPRPPKPPRRPKGPLVALLAGGLVLVALATVITFLAVDTGEETVAPPPQPTPAPPTPTPEPKIWDLPTPPTVEPTEPPETAEPDDAMRRDPLDPIPAGEIQPGYEVLTDNPLYDEAVIDHPCDIEMAPPAADLEQERSRHQRLYDCTVALHQSALEATTVTETESNEFGVYADPHETACGSTPDWYTGVYCPTDADAWVDIGYALESDPDFKPSYGYSFQVANHEYGHHIQHRVGILMKSHEDPYLGDSEESGRRLELQAECLGGIALAREGLADEEWREAYQRGAEESDRQSVTHGSDKSRYYWLHRGWNAQTYGDCNTWIAPSDLVS